MIPSSGCPLWRPDHPRTRPRTGNPTPLPGARPTNITGEGSATYNRNAKAAAKSAFESNKQRFFNHLITAMKVPTLIRAIEADLAAGHAAVVQIVSTGEALMERRLAEIPTSE